ncbi:MAG: hypothetical protein ACXACC_10655 [Promethearchaeota archaeon]|jgi:hypothetical protein
MNIRKIIKEEIDGFEWTEYQAPNPLANISQDKLDLIKPEEFEWIPQITKCYGLNDVNIRKVERWDKVPLTLKDSEDEDGWVTPVRVDDVLIIDYSCITKPMSSSNTRIVDPNKYEI